MPHHPPVENLRLVTKVSKLYYEDGLTPDEITARLHLSRPRVVQFLKHARETGIVEVKISPPQDLFIDLESRLENRFFLQEAIVVRTDESDTQGVINQKIGSAAAEYLPRIIEDGDIIGVSWGSTLNHMAKALKPCEARDIQVVQMVGEFGEPDASEISHKIARTLEARLTLLSVPGMVEDLRIRKGFFSDNFVQKALYLFPKLTIAVVGIGTLAQESAVMGDNASLSRHDLEKLKDLGAVGDIALRFFDSNGAPLHSQLDQQIIGITLEQLARTRKVVAAAGGLEKLAAIRGALNGGLVNVLIIDSVTAPHLLESVHLQTTVKSRPRSPERSPLP